MRRVKIVHILLGKANPERQNGVNRVVFELATSQCEMGNKTEVWGITHNPMINFSERSFKTRLFQDYRLKYKLASALKKAIKNAEKGTVFHLHGGFLPQMYMVVKQLVKYQQAYIYTPHGAFNTQAMKRSKWKKRIYVRLFEKSIVNHAKYIHVIGTSEIAGTKRIFGTSIRVELVPNGHRLSSEETKEIVKCEKRTHFGFLGRLDIHTKGIDILLDGFEKLIAKGSNAILHIGGNGKDFQRIKRQMEEKGMADNVLFYGAVFGKEKDQFLSRLNYLCLTSRNEGLPGVVLESLAKNIPCIVSKETNMGEAIESHDAGFVLTENTSEVLASNLAQAENIIQTVKYKQQCHNARRLIKDHFEWSKIASRLIQKFYES